MTDSKPTIVIYAEDKIPQRRRTTASLMAKGYDVRAFEDGLPALGAVRNLSDDERMRTVVLTDNLMFEMDGDKFANLLSQEYPNLPVVLASSMTDFLVISNTYGKVIDKSGGIDGMVAAMEEVLARSRGQEPPAPPERKDSGRGGGFGR